MVFFSTLETIKSLSVQSLRNFLASSIVSNLLSSSAVKLSSDTDMKFAVVLNDDLASKLFISFSLSTTNFTATD